MSDQAGSNFSTVDQSSTTSDATSADKGKGKAPTQEKASFGAMDIDDESEESEHEEAGADEDDDEEEEDDLQEIDPDNIVAGGRRTRGKVIDFAKAAEDSKGEIDDDEEEDDDDFEAPDEEMQG